jgi:hypothetical protein
MSTPRVLALGCLLVIACGDAKAPASTAGAPVADGDPMTDYLQRSKAAEANVNLRAIATGVRAVSMAEHIGRDGTEQRVGLDNAPLTPAAGECCEHPGKKCPPGEWDHPTWQAIGFALSDPHYYSYELVIDDTGFVARAVGDLDCDGEHGIHELRGTAKPDGTFELAPEPTSDNPAE